MTEQEIQKRIALENLIAEKSIKYLGSLRYLLDINTIKELYSTKDWRLLN